MNRRISPFIPQQPREGVKSEDEVATHLTDGAKRRKNWTAEGNLSRQMAVNFMPSRQLAHIGNTVRLRNRNPEDVALLEDLADSVEPHTDAARKHVDVIVRQMEKDESLMDDSPESEQLRLDALRDMPQCLTLKRNVRVRLSASVSMRSKYKTISCWKRLRYRISFGLKKVSSRIKNFVVSLELWYEAIRTVEGHFGSAIASYFYFLRWLFLMNLLLSIMIISFLIVPQAMHNTYGRNQTAHDEILEIMPGLNNPHSGVLGAIVDIASGQGILQDTILFYGHYSPDIMSWTPNTYYNIPYAYFFTMVVLYLFFFIILALRVIRFYRRTFILTAGGLTNVYAMKVFCGWDFGISTSRAAELKSASIFNELRELLAEQNKEKKALSGCEKFFRNILFLIINVVVLALMAGTGLMVWWLIDPSFSEESALVTELRGSVYWALIMAVIINIIIIVAPVVFGAIVRLEHYTNPRVALYLTLVRSFMLQIIVMAVFLVYWLNNNNSQCWETQLGQELYRLIVFDTLFSIVFIPLIDLVRSILFKYCQNYSAPKFYIANNTLSLIYNQTLLWIGLFFSPGLVVLVTIKFAVLFYVKRASALNNCENVSKSYRAAQTQTVFLALVFLALSATLIIFGYILTRPSSQVCGPFQNYVSIYQLLLHDILDIRTNSDVYFFLLYFTRPWVVAFLMSALGVAVYYMRARSLAHKSNVSILREMLILEAKDKEFLLNAITKVTDGEWEYNPKAVDNLGIADNSHTWKYLHDERFRKPSNSGYQFRPTEHSHSGRASTSYNDFDMSADELTSNFTGSGNLRNAFQNRLSDAQQPDTIIDTSHLKKYNKWM